MSKQIYLVTGYIPSDENKVYMHIWCLIKTKKCFYWIDAVNNSMIGGGTDNPGYETIEEALINIHGFTHSDWEFVLTDDFQEVLDVYHKMLTQLNTQIT